PGYPRGFHSFPTRRSSDLQVAVELSEVDRWARPTGASEESSAPPAAPEASAADVAAPDLTTRNGSAARVETELDPSECAVIANGDRKSTRLNSSHVEISYA